MSFGGVGCSQRLLHSDRLVTAFETAPSQLDPHAPATTPRSGQGVWPRRFSAFGGVRATQELVHGGRLKRWSAEGRPHFPSSTQTHVPTPHATGWVCVIGVSVSLGGGGDQARGRCMITALHFAHDLAPARPHLNRHALCCRRSLPSRAGRETWKGPLHAPSVLPSHVYPSYMSPLFDV